MRKILEVKIDEGGKVFFSTEYAPLKGMNLYQHAFVSLMFEPDIALVRKTIRAIQLLGIADLCACRSPHLSMSMFEKTLDDLQGIADQFRQHLGNNLNFKLGTA